MRWPHHSRARRARRTTKPDPVPETIKQLIMSWTTTPAYVVRRYLVVLAANPLATAIAPWFKAGENLVRAPSSIRAGVS
jgi:hypothetical protein